MLLSILTVNLKSHARFFKHCKPRENELRERIPVPRDNFLKPVKVRARAA